MSLSPWFKRAANLMNFGKSFDALEQELAAFNTLSGLSLSSDDKNVYVEADVPGLTADQIDVSLDPDGILSIRGESREEEKGKQYFKRSNHIYSYCIPLGNQIDPDVEPEASCNNGVMTIKFAKSSEGKKKKDVKKITVKKER